MVECSRPLHVLVTVTRVIEDAHPHADWCKQKQKSKDEGKTKERRKDETKMNKATLRTKLKKKANG